MYIFFVPHDKKIPVLDLVMYLYLYLEGGASIDDVLGGGCAIFRCLASQPRGGAPAMI